LLPNGAHPAQLAPARVVAEPPPGAVFPRLPQEGDRPGDSGGSQPVGGSRPQLAPGGLQLVGPEAGPPRSGGVVQGRRVPLAAVGSDPVVDALTGSPPPPGQLGDGLTPIDFEESQDAARGRDILRLLQVAAEPPPLPGLRSKLLMVRPRYRA
jgi:hypothetical protein